MFAVILLLISGCLWAKYFLAKNLRAFENAFYTHVDDGYVLQITFFEIKQLQSNVIHSRRPYHLPCCIFRGKKYLPTKLTFEIHTYTLYI
jgi:hypothetical protein